MTLAEFIRVIFGVEVDIGKAGVQLAQSPDIRDGAGRGDVGLFGLPKTDEHFSDVGRHVLTPISR
jgi:hypothetical protein